MGSVRLPSAAFSFSLGHLELEDRIMFNVSWLNGSSVCDIFAIILSIDISTAHALSDFT